MTFAANISLWIGPVLRLWLLLVAATFAPFSTFAYHGWNNANLAYDGIHESAIGYDAVHERSTRETRNTSLGNCGFFARFARFLAAKTEVTALTKFYPENAGFAGATERTFLMPGQTIDRYGGSGYSRFFSPQGTPDWARSLPPGTAGQPLRTFEVVKPFEVQSGTVAPWFNQPGGGLQYRTPVNLHTLLNRGIIRETP